MNSEALHLLFDAFNRHDLDTAMASFTEDCVFDTHLDKKIVGKAAVTNAFENTYKTFKDARWELEKHHFAGDDVIVTEWTFTGTAASGERTEVRGSDIFTLRDGKILVKNAFRKYQ